MTTVSNLPEEILLEIFTRIPVKSVGKCRCVSKQWLANLSTSQFIHLHRNRHQQQENLLLVFGDVGPLHTMALPLKDENVSTELSGLPRNWKRVLGSCNGLVLLLNDRDELFLVNPVMQQQVRVPYPPSVLDFKGFGYDSSKDDYKILSLTTYFNHPSETKKFDTFAYVYSLKMGVWRSVPCDFCHRDVVEDANACGYVNGVIHWLSRRPYTLATFNLADEVFGVIPLPDDNHISRLLEASVLRGCLILVGDVEFESNTELKACIMEEYGVHESWSNFTINISGVSSIRIAPLCSVGKNEVMMWGDGSILLSNLETQETKTVVVNGACPYSCDVIVFVESLVSPSSFTSVAEENDGTNSANNTLEAGPSQAPPCSSG